MLLFGRGRSVSVAAYSLSLSLSFRKSWKPMTSATIMAMAMKKCANLPARSESGRNYMRASRIAPAMMTAQMGPMEDFRLDMSETAFRYG